MCMLVGLIFPMASITLAGPVPKSSIADIMPTWLQMWMAGMVFFGCAIKLHGVITGTRWWFPNMTRKRSYSFGFIGAPFAATGLWVYGYFQAMHTTTWTSTFAAVLAPMLGLGIAGQAFMYFLEYRRIERNEDLLIAVAKSKVQRDNDANS